MHIVLASNNPHKMREFRRLLPTYSLRRPADVGLDFRHQESGSSFLQNALGKAHALRQQSGGQLAVIADDSGICVNALQGAPGIFSARYGNDHSTQTLNDRDRCQLLLQALAETEDRRAYYVCCVVLLHAAERITIVQEIWPGEIATTYSSGRHGFGYDPIFYLPDLGKTVAEIGDAEKDRLSHRGRALRGVGAVLANVSDQ